MPIIGSRTLLLLFFITTITIIKAQSIDSVKSISDKSIFGIRAGLNISSIGGGSSSDKHNFKLGYHFGTTWRKTINHHFYLNSSFLFSLQGYKNEVKSGSTTYTTNYNNYHINIPVLVNVNMGQYISFGIGPQLGLLLNSRSKETNSTNSNTIKSNSVQFNSIDLEISSGFSARLDDNFVLSAIYNHGITTSSTYSRKKGFNYVGQIGLHYYFNKKKS